MERASFDFTGLASFGTIGVILAIVTVVGSWPVLRRVSKLNYNQLRMVLLFFIAIIVLSFIEDFFFKQRGPWVFVGIVQGVEKRIQADNNSIYEFFDDKDPTHSIEYIFYVRHQEMKDGDQLEFDLFTPQPGAKVRNKAKVCFWREPNSYSERTLENGDIVLEPLGAAGAAPKCKSLQESKVEWGIFSPALANTATIVAQASDASQSNLVYKPSVENGLCNWESIRPSVAGETLVVCDAGALTAANPGQKELSIYLSALRNERTDTSTKASVLQKLIQLTDEQKAELNKLSPSTAYCDKEDIYPDPLYVEPLPLTLFDLEKSTDRQISGLSSRAIEAFKAESLFSDFIARGQCRNIWILRLDLARARRISELIGANATADVASLDVTTEDQGRTVIKPTATANGDLYQVEIRLPAGDDSAARCLAKVFRLVQMQDIPGAALDPNSLTQRQLDDLEQLEYRLLKSRFQDRPRTVGWYSKIFQRDLLVGAHKCGDNVSALAVQPRSR